jgi:hypothetical protein
VRDRSAPEPLIATTRQIHARIAVLITALAVTGAGAQVAPPGAPAPSDKEQRSVAAQKIDSQLLHALYARRGESAARGTPTETTVEVDAHGRTLIDVRAEVTPQLEQRVRALGGTIVSTSETHRTILARFPLTKLEELASLQDVRFVQPAARAVTN